MRRRGWGAGVLLVTALGVAAVGCGASDSKSASDRAPSAPDGVVAAQAPTELGAVTASERKQVRTGDMALAVQSADDVSRVADEAIAAATDAGGQVDDDQRTGGASPAVDLVLRVPPNSLDATVNRIAELATVTNRSVQTEDVTSQYTDLEGRIGALQISTERLRGFLGAATDANQIASIESELTRRESDLESLQGQLRVLSAKTDLATLKVAIHTEDSVASAKAPAPTKALAAGWNTFRLMAAWALAIVLALAPFLAVAAVVLLAVRWRRRRSSSSSGRGPSSPPPPPPPFAPGGPTSPTAAPAPPPEPA